MWLAGPTPCVAHTGVHGIGDDCVEVGGRYDEAGRILVPGVQHLEDAGARHSKRGSEKLARKIMNQRVEMPAVACKVLHGLLNRDTQKQLC